MYRYILFDLDGTLTDPKEGICRSVQYALEQAGREAPELDALTPFIGPPLADSFREYCSMEEAAVQKAVEDYRVRFSKIGWRENVPYEGIAELLKSCRRSGARLAVASSKPLVFVERILDYFHLKRYFDVIVGSGLDGSLGTKAEVVHAALERLYAKDGERLSAEEKRSLSVMVGDRKYDIEGARSEEIDAIGVAYGYQQPGELAAAGADAIARDVPELRELLIGGIDSRTYQRQRRREERAAQQEALSAAPLPEGALRRSLYMLSPLIVYYLIDLVIALVLALALRLYAGSPAAAEQLAESRSYTFLLCLRTLPILLVLWLGYRRRDALPQGLDLRRGKAWLICLLSLAAGAVLALALNSAFGWLRDLLRLEDTASYRAQSGEGISFLPGSAYLTGLLLYGFLSPLREEMIFRWVMLGRVRRVFGTAAAIVLTSLFFGVYHGNVLQGCYAFAMGLVMAYACVRWESVLPPLLFHMAANIIVYTAAYL